MEIHINKVTLAITARCQMNCGYCESKGNTSEMSLSSIKGAIEFAKKTNERGYLIAELTGGEPLCHGSIVKVFELLKDLRVNHVSILSNGLLLTKEHLEILSGMFEQISFYIALDSISKPINDHIKGYDGAYEGAVKALQMVSEARYRNISCLAQMLVVDKTLAEMEHMLNIAKQWCDGIVFTSKIPASLKEEDKIFFMAFLKRVNLLQRKYNRPKDFFVQCRDALIRILNPCCNYPCLAGVGSVYIRQNGEANPCPYLKIPLNIVSIKDYMENPFIKGILSRDLKGKCRECSKAALCIGCRARAKNLNGDELGEDPYCCL